MTDSTYREHVINSWLVHRIYKARDARSRTVYSTLYTAARLSTATAVRCLVSLIHTSKGRGADEANEGPTSESMRRGHSCRAAKNHRPVRTCPELPQCVPQMALEGGSTGGTCPLADRARYTTYLPPAPAARDCETDGATWLPKGTQGTQPPTSNLRHHLLHHPSFRLTRSAPRSPGFHLVLADRTAISSPPDRTCFRAPRSSSLHRDRFPPPFPRCPVLSWLSWPNGGHGPRKWWRPRRGCQQGRAVRG